MKKKVGVLNFHFSYFNYGAVLQAYALQKVIEEMGFEVENIDLKPKMFFLIKILHKFLRNPFPTFRKLYLKETSSSYYTLDDLKKEKWDKFHAFVVGSDQVWRANYCHEPLAYFLSFVPQGVKRVSYAASFGLERWEKPNNNQLEKKILNEVTKMDYISVREDSGITICNEVFNLKAKQVLDPILLADTNIFDKIAKYKANSPKIVYYKLDKDDAFMQIIKHVEENTGFSAKNIYNKSIKIFGKEIQKFGKPTEWIGYIKNCEYVITDSFHATCFAILYGKRLIITPNNKRGNSRLNSLLKLFNLENRLYTNTENLKTNNSWKKPLDQLNIEEVLLKERKISQEFLNQALQ